MAAIVLLAIFLLLTCMVTSIFKINAHTYKTYDYKPFSLRNFFAILPAYLLGVIGFLFNENASALNVIVMYVACLAYLLYLVRNMAQKTNLSIAVYSVFVMAIAWAPILLMALLRLDVINKRGHS